MYKLHKEQTSPNVYGEVDYIIRLSDNSFIPLDNANRHYQEYLKWCDGYELINNEWVKTSEGNTPEPADE